MIYDPIPKAPRATQLSEQRDLVNPELQEPGHLRFSQGRSESRSHANGHSFSLDDHRASHDLESERKFVARMIDDSIAVAKEAGARSLVVIAEPKLLGFLRGQIAETTALQEFEVTSLAKGLSKRPLAEIEDAIRDAGLIAPRV